MNCFREECILGALWNVSLRHAGALAPPEMPHQALSLWAIRTECESDYRCENDETERQHAMSSLSMKRHPGGWRWWQFWIHYWSLLYYYYVSCPGTPFIYRNLYINVTNIDSSLHFHSQADNAQLEMKLQLQILFFLFHVFFPKTYITHNANLHCKPQGARLRVASNLTKFSCVWALVLSDHKVDPSQRRL